MPWRKNIAAGAPTGVADRIGAGTFCKKICKTAKGGSMVMTASRDLQTARKLRN